MQYQSLRSVSDNHLFIVCLEDKFYEIAADIRRQGGPWQARHRGNVYKLKPEYRLARARRLHAREVRARGVQAGDVLRLASSQRVIKERQHSAVSFRVMRTCKGCRCLRTLAALKGEARAVILAAGCSRRTDS